jgi:predicted amidohydrolase YtcJ
MIDLGIPVGAGTDATVVSSPNPWLCIWWMISGKSVDGSPPRVEAERLSTDEALRLFTSGSAWFSFEEKDRGNLKTGSHADLVVLTKDPFTVAVDEIPTIEADLTIVGGKVVHDSGELAVPVLGAET